MPKPICVPCRRFYRVQTNGIKWEEGKPERNNVPPGPEASADWGPYKLWQSDLWRCPNCQHEIIVGHAGAPLAEHYEPDYAATKEAISVYIRVNDC